MPTDRLYPDVMAAGSIGRAVEVRARRSGVPWRIGRANWQTDDMISAVVRTDHGDVRIMVGAKLRVFIVSVWRMGALWISGNTPDLDAVTRFVAAWHDGISLAEAHSRWPFMAYERLAEARESGDAVAVKWQLLDADPGADYVRDVLNAAAARPELAQLFPWLSHHGTRLHFSRCTGYPFSRDVPYIQGNLASYQVIDDRDGTLLGEYPDPADAVAAVVNSLPEGIGPAVDGDRSVLPELER
ncbi:Uncharacterised protein [Mycobacterium tuberculosis]|nr:Uncharacterised protein [Mycobacterium tuberculosis]